jgi:hypothetical protein
MRRVVAARLARGREIASREGRGRQVILVIQEESVDGLVLSRVVLRSKRGAVLGAMEVDLGR